MEIQSFFSISEPVSSLSHILAAVFFLFLGGKLVIKSHGNTLRQVSVIIFAVANVLLFAMSGTYHYFAEGEAPKYVFRVLDHDAIYFIMAGTFTPVHVILTRGFSRWGIWHWCGD